MYARMLIRNVGWDDWLMLLATLLLLTVCILGIFFARQGDYRHIYYMSLPDIQRSVKQNLIAQPFGIMGVAFGKMSVATLMLRIIGRSKWRRIFLIIAIITAFLTSALSCILNFVQCNPPRALWTIGLPATCWKPEISTNFSIFTGGASPRLFLDEKLAMLTLSQPGRRFWMWPLPYYRSRYSGI